jgi:hypothetical protein
MHHSAGRSLPYELLLNKHFKNMTLRFTRTTGRTERGLQSEASLHITTGIERLGQVNFQGWQIGITHRQVAIMSPRSQYTASIRAMGMQQPILLSGFATNDAALQAAKDWITLRSDAPSRIPASKRRR